MFIEQETPLTRNPTDPSSVGEAKARKKSREDQWAADLRQIMQEQWGRRFVFEFLTRCGVFRQSYVEGDTHGTTFNEGRRSIGNVYFASIAKDMPELYGLMTKEAWENQRRERSQKNKNVKISRTEDDEND